LLGWEKELVSPLGLLLKYKSSFPRVEIMVKSMDALQEPRRYDVFVFVRTLQSAILLDRLTFNPIKILAWRSRRKSLRVHPCISKHFGYGLLLKKKSKVHAFSTQPVLHFFVARCPTLLDYSLLNSS
jgi:hypothetical protein